MKYHELSDKAKETALDRCRYLQVDGYDWWAAEYEYLEQWMGELGFMDFAISGFDLYHRTAKWVGHWEYRDIDFNQVPDDLKDLMLVLHKQHTLLKMYDGDSRPYVSLIGRMPSVSCRNYDVAPEDILIEDEIYEASKTVEPWIVDMLDNQYEWLISDECVMEMIEANDYDFNERGERA